MAMRASKGADDADVGGAVEREARSVVELPRRSPALAEEVEADWIWEAANRLDGAEGIVVSDFFFLFSSSDHLFPSCGRRAKEQEDEGGKEDTACNREREREIVCVRGCTYRWTPMGSSHEPGTDSTTMLLSWTPQASSFALVPSSRGSMISAFHRAWMMPMRRPVPSCCSGVGPFIFGGVGNGSLVAGSVKKPLRVSRRGKKKRKNRLVWNCFFSLWACRLGWGVKFVVRSSELATCTVRSYAAVYVRSHQGPGIAVLCCAVLWRGSAAAAAVGTPPASSAGLRYPLRNCWCHSGPGTEYSAPVFNCIVECRKAIISIKVS